MISILARLNQIYNKVYFWLMALILTKVLLFLTTVIMPFLYNDIVDNVMVKEGINRLFYDSIFIFTLVIAKWLFSILDLSIAEKYKKIFLKNSGKEVWNHYFYVYKNKSLGDAERLFDRDLVTISEFLNKYIAGNFIGIISIVIYFVIIFLKHWLMSLIILISIPIFLFLVIKLSKLNHTISLTKTEKENRNYHYLDKKMSNWLQVKMALDEKGVEEAYSKNIKEIVRDRNKMLVISLTIESLNYLMDNFLCKLLIYLLGSYFIIKGTITIGTVVLFVAFCGQIFKNIGEISKKSIDFSEDKISLERIFGVLNSQIKEKNQFLWKNKIELEGEQYGKVEIFHNDFVGIIGKSGSGKTTLINYILGKKNNDQICVYYDKTSINDLLQCTDFCSNLLDVSNGSYIFDITVYENLCYVHTLTSLEINQLCDVFHTDIYFFNKKTGKNGSFLSGGERQVLLMMRAYISEFDTIILDEITSALDKDRFLIFKNIIENKWKYKTRIVVTHDENLVEKANKIYRINGGRVELISAR